MIQAVLGQKTEQTQKFLENGRRVPVTKIVVSDNAVLQVKTAEKEGYTAVQLGFGSKRKTTKPLAGHIKKAGVSATPVAIKEVRIQDASEGLPQAGDMIRVEEVFKPGDIVDVTGTSKGKGFAGVVKRHNFRGGPKTHGQSDRHRAPGSIGQTTTPGRVYKGKRMAGRMGTDTVTVPNLTVLDVDAENKVLYVSGLVPGHLKAIVQVTYKGENKKFVPLLEVVRRAAESNSVSEEEKEEATSSVTNVEVVEEKAESKEAVTQETKEDEVNVSTNPTQEEVKEDGK